MDINDFFGQMPSRPSHPDFWKLSEVLLKLDSGLNPANPDEKAKEAQYQARLAEIGVDEKSLTYVAVQRAYRIVGIETQQDLLQPGKMQQVMMLAAIWTDAFAAGVFYERGTD